MIIRKKNNSSVTTSDAQGYGSKSSDSSWGFVGRNGELRPDSFTRRDGSKNILYSKQRQKKWRHPWHLEVGWGTNLVDGLGKKAPDGIAVIVTPGFVNGIDPVVGGVYIDSYQASDKDIGGERVEISSLRSQGKQQAALLDYPLIGLNAGYAWHKPKRVPYMVKQYFSNLLLDPKDITAADLNAASVAQTGKGLGNMRSEGFADAAIDAALGINVDTSGGDPGEFYREIRVTDFYIANARPALAEERFLSSDGFGGIVNNTFATVNTLSLSQWPRPIIRFGQLPEPSVATGFNAFQSIGSGKNEGKDSGIDYLKLGSIFAISPETQAKWVSDPAGGGWAYKNSKMPGKDWDIYVTHDVFWNLCHRAKNPKEVQYNSGPNLGIALAAGGGMLGLALAAPMIAANSMLQNMQDNMLKGAMGTKSNNGLFWTT